MADRSTSGRGADRSRGRKNARRTGSLTARKRQLFVEKLREKGSVWHACKAAGVSRTTVYRWRDESKEFQKQWADAAADAHLQKGCDLVESVWDKAINGWLEPVFHKGKPCGAIRRFSSSLMIFVLKAKCGWRDDEVDPNSNSARETAASIRAALLSWAGAVPPPPPPPKPAGPPSLEGGGAP